MQGENATYNLMCSLIQQIPVESLVSSVYQRVTQGRGHGSVSQRDAGRIWGLWFPVASSESAVAPVQPTLPLPLCGDSVPGNILRCSPPTQRVVVPGGTGEGGGNTQSRGHPPRRVTQKVLTIKPLLSRFNSKFLTYTSNGPGGQGGLIFIWQQYLT